ncbi:DNA glycosylase [Microdochium bolleyi]|uniref:DNA glycosylase n=1 Tax=Microdochium bolleyi TaxID=196109 RepID=A0A136IQ09_9PEZI|nr:DNA glycosylase [Microdochium bolleyi]
MARASRAGASSAEVKTEAVPPRRRSARIVKVEDDAEEESTGQTAKGANGRKRRASAAAATTDVNGDNDADENQKQHRATPKRGKRIKTEPADGDDHADLAAIKAETPTPRKATRGGGRGRRGAVKAEADAAAKQEDDGDDVKPSPSPGAPAITPSKADALQARKLKSYSQYANKSPFPDFARPTAEECKLAHKILVSIHGARERTKQEDLQAPANRAGCGDSPSVLDALVRTILSQNTSDTNSTRAKLSMDAVYGGSDRWEDILAGGEAKLQKAIQCGGLSVVKSRVIISILRQCKEKYGKYSLDHLFQATNDEAMTEMLGFQGVGPKTASCVLLFCLRRESFAVDTHVHRITGLLGWRPPGASRDEAHAHLDARVPDEDKYGLHILLVTHGKKCDDSRARRARL